MKTHLPHLPSSHPVHPSTIDRFFNDFSPSETATEQASNLVAYLKEHEKKLTRKEFKVLVEDSFFRACSSKPLVFLKSLLSDPCLGSQVSHLTHDTKGRRCLEIALEHGDHQAVFFLLGHEKFKERHDLFFENESVVSHLNRLYSYKAAYFHKEKTIQSVRQILEYENFPSILATEMARLFCLLHKSQEEDLCRLVLQKSGNEEGVLRALLVSTESQKVRYSGDDEKNKEHLLAAYRLASPSARLSFFEHTKDFLEESHMSFAEILSDQGRVAIKKHIEKSAVEKIFLPKKSFL